MVKDKTKDQEQESEEAEETAAKTATEEAEEEESQQEESQEEESEEQSEEEESEEESEEEEAEEESQEEEQEEKPSRRQNKAIERLTKKLAEVNQQRETGQEQLSEEDKKQLLEEGDYTLDELNEKFGKYGEQRYKQGLSEAQQHMDALTFATRLEIDTPKVAQKYPILDNNSDKFDPAIADYINRNYLKVVGFDPNNGTVQNSSIRYDEYADATMEMIDAVAASRSADSQRNIAKQAAKTGVRPGGSAKKPYTGTDPRKMSNEQLEAEINRQLGITPR